MIFNKIINKYYIRFLAFFLIGILALMAVDIVQTFIPQFLGQIIDDNNSLITDNEKLTQIIVGRRRNTS